MKIQHLLIVIIFCLINTVSSDNINQLAFHGQYMQAASAAEGQIGPALAILKAGFTIFVNVVKKMELVLSIITFIILLICNFFHERKAAIDSKRFAYARKICEAVKLDDEQEQSKIEQGKTMYLCGKTSTKVQMEVPILKIKMLNLLKIVLRAETMEWRSKSLNCCSAEKVKLQWAAQNQPMIQQKFNNLLDWIYKPATFYNPSVFLGKYPLNNQILGECYKKKDIKPKEYAPLLHEIADQGDRILSFDQKYIYLTPKANLSQGKLAQTLGMQRMVIQIYEATSIAFVSKYESGKFVKFCITQDQQVNQSVKDIKGSQIDQNESDMIGQIPQVVQINKMITPDEEMFNLYQKKWTKSQFFSRVSRRRVLINTAIRLLLILAVTGTFFLFLMSIPQLKDDIPGYGPIISSNLLKQIGVCLLFAAFIIFFMAIIIWLIFNRSATLIFFFIFLFLVISALVLILVLHKKSSSQSLKVELPHMMVMLRNRL